MLYLYTHSHTHILTYASHHMCVLGTYAHPHHIRPRYIAERKRKNKKERENKKERKKERVRKNERKREKEKTGTEPKKCSKVVV